MKHNWKIIEDYEVDWLVQCENCGEKCTEAMGLIAPKEGCSEKLLDKSPDAAKEMYDALVAYFQADGMGQAFEDLAYKKVLKKMKAFKKSRK